LPPTRLETFFLCHYAHTDDLESTSHASAEMRDWMVQSKLQLVRRYRGRMSEFVQVATAYARSAVERMELWQGVDGGRRVCAAAETFRDAKKRMRFFPRPQSPDSLKREQQSCAAAKDHACRRKPKHG
jgi:hypothetical protein